MTETAAEQKEKVPEQGRTVADAEGVIRFLRRYAGWLVVAVPFFIHLWVAVRNLRLGIHGILPEFADVSGAGVAVWIQTYRTLFVRPETWTVMARLYALWTLVFLVLSIYRALREENSVLYGVALFLAHGLAGVVILAVLTPTVWVLLAGWGPRIVELTPPVVLLFIGVILTITARNASS